MDYILDTNIVLTYLRNNQLARNLEQKLDLLSGQHNLIISVVSIGELRSNAKRNNWGTLRIELLDVLKKPTYKEDLKSLLLIYREMDRRGDF